MATPVIKGTSSPQAQSVTQTFTLDSGYITRYEYQGIGYNQILALYNSYIAQGISCTLTNKNNGIYYLDVEDSTQSYSIDTWTLNGADQQVSILYHPKVLNLATADQVALLNYHLNLGDKPSVAFADTGLSSLSGGAVQTFYQLYQNGVTDFENDYDGSGYVLEHTTNAPNYGGPNVADNNVGQIYTTSQLLSECANTLLWTRIIPASMYYQISNIPSNTQSGYQWGWKKSRPSKFLTANNRIDIRTTYTLALWNTTLYTVHP